MDQNMVKITEGFYYNPEKVLGQGCFGKVYTGFSKQQNKIIAVKEVLSAGYNEREVDTLKVLSSLVHPNIMSFYGFQVLSEKVYMFIEFLPNGPLTDFITKGIAEQQIITIFRQILQGMCYINAKGQMHRDLKPDNILLGDKNSVKICDFGLARQANNDLRMTGKQGTPLYAAPQVYCNKQEKYDQKIDVWSAGLILFEMIKGKNAFANIKTFNDLHKQWAAFGKGKMMQISENVHPEWQYLINIMLTYNPDKRPTFDDVLQKFKIIEPKMRAQIKIKKQNPQKKYEQICGDQKWKKLKRYLQFYSQKSLILVEPMALLQGSFKHIKKSVQYLVIFMALARYLVRLKDMIKNLKYKQLEYPDGQQAIQNQNDAKILSILLDKYRNIFQNLSINYQEKLKSQFMKKILSEFSTVSQDKILYDKLQKTVGMVIDVKNGCYDLQDDYEQMLGTLMKHEFVCQNEYKIKKMPHQQLKTYSMLLLANNLDKVFPDKMFQQGILPKEWAERLKNGQYQELLDFALRYQTKK